MPTAQEEEIPYESKDNSEKKTGEQTGDYFYG
jgi:hypothetical protein